MTIIVPTAGTRIDYVADLLSDFHHGAGSQGNTSLLRTQDVAQPDGTIAKVPFLSGASIRHGLRDEWAAAGHPGEPTLEDVFVDLVEREGSVSRRGTTG